MNPKSMNYDLCLQYDIIEVMDLHRMYYIKLSDYKNRIFEIVGHAFEIYKLDNTIWYLRDDNILPYELWKITAPKRYDIFSTLWEEIVK